MTVYIQTALSADKCTHASASGDRDLNSWPRLHPELKEHTAIRGHLYPVEVNSSGVFSLRWPDTFPGNPTTGKNATVPLWLSGYLQILVLFYWTADPDVRLNSLSASAHGALHVHTTIFFHGLSNMSNKRRYSLQVYQSYSNLSMMWTTPSTNNNTWLIKRTCSQMS